MSPLRHPPTLLLCLLLAGCAGGPLAPQPGPVSRLSIAANHQGTTLYVRGDYTGALQSFQQALRHDLSLDHAEGIAGNLINLSLVYQRLGRTAEAEQAIERLLAAPYPQLPHQTRAEAWLRLALLQLDRDDTAGAGRSLAQVDALAGDTAALRARHDNLRAELALRAGERHTAHDRASRALAAARSSDEPEEAANALRTLGRIGLTDDRATARQHLLEALAIDKSLELPRKIARDLLLLGQASEGEEARRYLLRAEAAAEAAQDTATRDVARARLQR